MPVEADTALTDGELADVGPDSFVELGSAHAEVGGGLAGTENARQGRRGLCRAGCCHVVISRLGGQIRP
ncbi:hypothetical protein D3C79_896710 [compost metagenome]